MPLVVSCVRSELICEDLVIRPAISYCETFFVFNFLVSTFNFLFLQEKYVHLPDTSRQFCMASLTILGADIRHFGEP
jgi:hypothetical protein